MEPLFASVYGIGVTRLIARLVRANTWGLVSVGPGRMRRHLFAFLCSISLLSVHAQFGNVQVHWDAAQPRVQTDTAPMTSYKPPTDVRREALSALPVETLSQIFTELRPGMTCDACTNRGHWVSEIRSACLEASPKVTFTSNSVATLKADRWLPPAAGRSSRRVCRSAA